MHCSPRNCSNSSFVTQKTIPLSSHSSLGSHSIVGKAEGASVLGLGVGEEVTMGAVVGEAVWAADGLVEGTEVGLSVVQIPQTHPSSRRLPTHSGGEQN